MSNAISNANKRRAALKYLETVPPEYRDELASLALKSQKAILPIPYHSSVRFAGVQGGTTPNFTYTVSTEPRRAFAYAQGQNAVAAGFASGTPITPSETNLRQASTTNDNATVYIYGLCILVEPTSDPGLVAALFPKLSVSMSLSGTDYIDLGTPAMWPGAGGLYGAGRSLVTPGPVDTSEGSLLSFFSNGNPQVGQFRKFPQPYVWNANGSGEKDSSLNVSLTPTAAVSIPGTERTADTGIEGFTPAAAIEALFKIVLVSVQTSNRSLNQ